jgi:hypothetical protein
MNSITQHILEKYNPDDIFKLVLDHYSPTSIKGGSFVMIDPEALKNPDISKELIMKRGEDWFGNLTILAKNKTILYVSALKTVRPTSAYIAELPANNFDEADLVVHKTPGLYYAPITVPVSILKMTVDPMYIMQQPIDSDLEQKVKITKADKLDNEYNKGEQPKGSITKGGNN